MVRPGRQEPRAHADIAARVGIAVDAAHPHTVRGVQVLHLELVAATCFEHLASSDLTAARAEVMQTEQQLQVEGVHQGNAQRALEALVSRRDRLRMEQNGLNRPDEEAINRKSEELARRDLNMVPVTAARTQYLTVGAQ